MRLILIIFIALLSNIASEGQPGSTKEQINLYNQAGKKTGFWNELVGDLKREVYYIDGKRNGLEKVYFRKGSLAAFGTYENDHPIGVSYFFHELGYITFTVKYMGPVTYKGRKLQKGFFALYNSRGKIEQSGIGLFVEGEEELGEEIRIGQWKKL
jgi:antitoxin component YwqK of YwqJK toxin-antitoxin module